MLLDLWPQKHSIILIKIQNTNIKTINANKYLSINECQKDINGY